MLPWGMEFRRVREAHGWDQKTLAEAVPMARSYLSRAELGLKPPLNGEVIKRIAEILELTDEEQKRLEEARLISAVRFQLPEGLTPMQVELANRFHKVLARLSPLQVSTLNTQLLDEQEAPRSKPRPR